MADLATPDSAAGAHPAQGGLALNPRCGSSFLGGISISPIRRRFITNPAGP